MLSHIHIAPLFAARNAASAIISPDLGLTHIKVQLHAGGVQFPDGQALSWSSLEEIADSATACFLLENGALQKIQRFSEETGRACSLMPTHGAPTLLLAGFPMHRIKGTDPYRDTRSKVKAVAPLVGRVLDTTTGLGYTAIEASKTADEVITVELDPAVLEIARLNPWSRALFDSRNITQLLGDSTEVVEEFHDNSFARVIHDPPTFSLAGELYSQTFYRQLYRVLKRGGRLFHYVGDLDSKLGRRVMKGAVRRLQDAGFQTVRRVPAAFGLAAYK